MTTSKGSAVALCLTGALAMSFGWGFRGDYGHEAGAMVPGALTAMGVCLCSGRADWFRRCAIMGLAGALGWAFGGQMSYGQITVYTVSDSFPDVAYGYACLFIIGALWGGIGGAILSLSLTDLFEYRDAPDWAEETGIIVSTTTRSYRHLGLFIGPLVAFGVVRFGLWMLFLRWPELGERCDEFSEKLLHDTDWLAASLALVVAGLYWLASPKSRPACSMMLLMGAGWWVGYLALVWVFRLHMSPTPLGEDVRSDNWAGCVGLFAVLLAYLSVKGNRAGVMLAMYGALAGGIGFSVGDFINKPDKVQWPPFYTHEWLRGFDHWKWTEQSFGLMMGLGVALGLLRLLRGNLEPPPEDPVSGQKNCTRLNDLAVFVLLIPMMWMNLRKNVRKWASPEISALPQDELLGLEAWKWFLLIGVLLSFLVVYAQYRYRNGRLPLAPQTAFGKGQFLFLLILWVAAIGALLQAFPALKSRGILFVHASFWLTGIACTGLVLRASPEAMKWQDAAGVPPDDLRWRLGWRHWLLWALAPVLIVALTAMTLAMHEGPAGGGILRFGPHAYHVPAASGMQQ